MNGFARADDGQALVIVGLAMFVLLGALALSIDWGYGLATRRATQNQADAAALAAGKLLASSFTGATPQFSVTQDDAWCEAARWRDANLPGRPASATDTLDLAFSSDGATWTPLVSTADCKAGGGLGDPVPAGTVYVRAIVKASYNSLFGAISGQPVTAGASARVRLTAASGARQLTLPAPVTGTIGIGLSGATTSPTTAMWPLARHFDSQHSFGANQDFSGGPCGEPCDPTVATAVQLWPATSGSDDAFTVVVTYGHKSPHEYSAGSDRHQLLSESDYRGTSEGTPTYPNTLGALVNANSPKNGGPCGATTWDTAGAPANGQPTSTITTCDVPNWFYYGNGGSLSVGTDWWDPSWSGYRGNSVDCSDPQAGRCPAPLPVTPAPRESCQTITAFLPTASCAQSTAPFAPAGTSTSGDWVETLCGPTGSGCAANNITPDMALRMRDFIGRYGRTTRYSSATVPKSGGILFGKAVVVHIFYWDCAMHFDGSKSVWSLVPGEGGDCSHLQASDLTSADADRRIDRIHLFTVVPFTFYEGLIKTSGTNVTVKAFWGDAFGDAGTCAWDAAPAACQPNQIMNSAFLVPDE